MDEIKLALITDFDNYFDKHASSYRIKTNSKTNLSLEFCTNGNFDKLLCYNSLVETLQKYKHFVFELCQIVVFDFENKIYTYKALVKTTLEHYETFVITEITENDFQTFIRKVNNLSTDHQIFTKAMTIE